MVAKFVTCKLTLGTAVNGCTNFLFSAPRDTYSDSNIKAATGIQETTANIDINFPKYKIEELILGGIASRVYFSYEKAGKLYHTSLLCSVENKATVDDDLVGKSFKGGTIKKVYEPRRAS